jgi:hypothetical protein
MLSLSTESVNNVLRGIAQTALTDNPYYADSAKSCYARVALYLKTHKPWSQSMVITLYGYKNDVIHATLVGGGKVLVDTFSSGGGIMDDSGYVIPRLDKTKNVKWVEHIDKLRSVPVFELNQFIKE